MRICDPISIMKVGRQHVCNKNQYTEGHKEIEKERERERANGKQWLTLEN
jgi:hypothetical protein